MSEVRGGMSDRRRELLRLEISREAARLFWAQGVAATSGDQIADAVGLSVRTLWRYFRNKESCVGPVVGQGAVWFMAMLRSWPPGLSLEDHYRVVLLERVEAADADRVADNLLLARMLELGKTEPAIRSAWLMACDPVEREMVSIVATRMRRPVDDADVRVHAAAATAVMRVVNEDLGVAYLADDTEDVDLWRVTERLAQAVRAATGGAIGDAISPPA